jgi:hypothetical protein
MNRKAGLSISLISLTGFYLSLPTLEKEEGISMKEKQFYNFNYKKNQYEI